MLPNRGIQIIGNGRRYIANNTARQFSSAVTQSKYPLASTVTQSKFRLSSTSTLLWRSNSRPRLLQIAPTILNATTLRFQSTVNPAPEEIPDVPAPPETPPPLDSATPETAFEFEQFNGLDFSAHIGYLKELGLDYGWGPTAMMEWILEHIHVLLGTPWWLSIGLTAVFVRAVMFKFFLMSTDNAAKMARVSYLIDPVKAQLSDATRRGDNDLVLKSRTQLKAIYNLSGVQIWKSLMPMTQIFAGFGMFKLMRGMAALPVPGLDVGGIIWFSNLAVRDPYFIIPAASAALIYIALKRGGELGVNTMKPSTARLLRFLGPTVTFIFTAWLPASLQVYLCVTTGLSVAQARLFSDPKYRRLLGITPLPNNSGASASKVPSPNTKRSYQSQVTYQPPRLAATKEQPESLVRNIKNVVGKIGDGTFKKSISERIHKSLDDWRETMKPIMDRTKPAPVDKVVEAEERAKVKASEDAEFVMRRRRERDMQERMKMNGQKRNQGKRAKET